MHLVACRAARRAAVLLALLTTLVMALGSAGVAATRPPAPGSMAAIGDSISRAADVCCWYGDHPSDSWSTGGNPWDGILSQYERLRRLNPAIDGSNYNNAVSGAQMSDGPGQARVAVDQGARYVTVLLGANDLCTSSPSTMTSVDTFRSETHQTLGILADGLPAHAHIFVASIPNVYQLWQLYHSDPLAELVWGVGHICQSLLAPDRTEAGRQAVAQRNIDFNTVLAHQCAQITRCRFDGDAVYNYQFTKSDISKLDYFHPSLDGQAALASVTWAASWWGS